MSTKENTKNTDRSLLKQLLDWILSLFGFTTDKNMDKAYKDFLKDNKLDYDLFRINPTRIRINNQNHYLEFDEGRRCFKLIAKGVNKDVAVESYKLIKNIVGKEGYVEFVNYSQGDYVFLDARSLAKILKNNNINLNEVGLSKISTIKDTIDNIAQKEEEEKQEIKNRIKRSIVLSGEDLKEELDKLVKKEKNNITKQQEKILAKFEEYKEKNLLKHLYFSKEELLHLGLDLDEKKQEIAQEIIEKYHIILDNDHNMRCLIENTPGVTKGNTGSAFGRPNGVWAIEKVGEKNQQAFVSLLRDQSYISRKKEQDLSWNPFNFARELTYLKKDEDGGLKIVIDGFDDTANALNASGLPQKTIDIIQGTLLFPAFLSAVHIGVAGLTGERQETTEALSEIQEKIYDIEEKIKNLRDKVLENNLNAIVVQSDLHNISQAKDELTELLFKHPQIITAVREKLEEEKAELEEEASDTKKDKIAAITGQIAMFNMFGSVAAFEVGAIANIFGGIDKFSKGLDGTRGFAGHLLGNRGAVESPYEGPPIGAIHGVANMTAFLGQSLMTAYAAYKSYAAFKEREDHKEKADKFAKILESRDPLIPRDLLEFNKIYNQKHADYASFQAFGNAMLSSGQATMAVCGPIGAAWNPGTYIGLGLTIGGIVLNTSTEITKNKKFKYNEKPSAAQEAIIKYYQKEAQTALTELATLTEAKRNAYKENLKIGDQNIYEFIDNNKKEQIKGILDVFSVEVLTRNAQLEGKQINDNEITNIWKGILAKISNEGITGKLNQKFTPDHVLSYAQDIIKIEEKICEDKDLEIQGKEITKIIQKRNIAMEFLAKQQSVALMAQKIIKESILDKFTEKSYLGMGSEYEVTDKFDVDEGFKKALEHYKKNDHQKMLVDIMDKNEDKLKEICKLPDGMLASKENLAYHWHKVVNDINDQINKEDITNEVTKSINTDNISAISNEYIVNKIQKIKQYKKVPDQKEIKRTLLQEILQDDNLVEILKVKLADDMRSNYKTNNSYPLEKLGKLYKEGGGMMQVPHDKNIYQLNVEKLMSDRGLKFVSIDTIIDVIRNDKKFNMRSDMFNSLLDYKDLPENEKSASAVVAAIKADKWLAKINQNYDDGLSR